MKKYLLKNGFIADGSGNAGYRGSVLIDGDTIAEVSACEISCDDAEVIDCTGLCIAPGFIDSHSHHDRFIHAEDELALLEPFIRQGITTYVAGNCGESTAGLAQQSGEYQDARIAETRFYTAGKKDIFYTYGEFFDYLRKKGLYQNLASMAAEGTALASITGLIPSRPVTWEDHQKSIDILNEGMDSGCKGISFGLGYRPGSFVDDDLVRKISQCAIDRNKLITIHERVMDAHATHLYGDDYSIPHNVRWQTEFIDRFRDTGARLHMSHLLFVGQECWPSTDAMMEMMDDRIKHGGMDLWFDFYSFTQGATSVQILMPPGFYKNLPDALNDPNWLPILEEERKARLAKMGWDMHDIQVCSAGSQELSRWNGMFFDEIIASEGITAMDILMQMYKASNGTAQVYLYNEQPEENVARLMTHERCLYMTDAWVMPGCHQNQCAYGTMPKFLRIARETGNQSMEQTVKRMTGNAALRFDLDRRGFIRKGYFADITIFNPDTVAETCTPKKPDSYPIGIEYVMVNGHMLLRKGELDASVKAGRIV